MLGNISKEIWFCCLAKRLGRVLQSRHFLKVLNRNQLQNGPKRIFENMFFCNLYKALHQFLCKTCFLLKLTFIYFQLKMFWSQLIAHDVVFSACGMCKISRKILTSVSTFTFSVTVPVFKLILLNFRSLLFIL